jgi:hypothetical protein
VVGFDIYRNGVRILKSELSEGVRFLGNERCFFSNQDVVSYEGFEGKLWLDKINCRSLLMRQTEFAT